MVDRPLATDLGSSIVPSSYAQNGSAHVDAIRCARSGRCAHSANHRQRFVLASIWRTWYVTASGKNWRFRKTT